MLTLEDFIAETMVSIVRGIKKSQNEPDVGDHIAPLIQGGQRNEFGNFHLKKDTSNQATIVQFEVSVGVQDTKTAGANAKLMAKLVVVGGQLGGGVTGQTESSSAHKLKFSIPVRIPKRTAKFQAPSGGEARTSAASTRESTRTKA